jgi:hypothetical protein
MMLTPCGASIASVLAASVSSRLPDKTSISGFGTNAGYTATNLPSSTNSPRTATAPDAAQIKLSAIWRVNEFWNVERDHVREETKISLKDRMHGDDDISSIDIDIICRVSEAEPVPDEITMHFISKSDDWRFLNYSAFIVNYDGMKKDFGELKVDGDVISGGRVLEQMIAHFSYEEFRKMAFAKTVLLNLGTQTNDEIVPSSRVKWQVLCNYFDLMKPERGKTAHRDSDGLSNEK